MDHRVAALLSRTALPAVALGALLAFKAFAALALASRGIPLFIDDAFYYLLIARNFAFSGIPAFDGIHPTNGFHPLWMLILAAMYRVIGEGAGLIAQLMAAKATELVALAGALAMCVLGFHRLRRATPLAWGFLGSAIVLVAPRLHLFEAGMESTLAAALLLACIYAILDDRPRWLALCLPLLFLARLDTLVFVHGPLLLWWIAARPGSWRRRAVVLAPWAITVAAYLALNLVLTGKANTISGQIKSSFPAISLHLNYLVLPFELAPHHGWRELYALPNALVPTICLAILAPVCAWRRKEPWARSVLWMLLIAFLLVANVVLFQRWDKGVEPRYLSLPYVLLGFAVLATLASLSGSGLAAAATFWISLLACAVVTGVRYREEIALRQDFTKIREVQALTKPEERFAGTDVGAFAFYLERTFVNLDGLANNMELQEAIRGQRLAQYFDRNRIRYLLAPFWDREQSHVSQRPERMYRSRIFPAGVAGTDYPHYDFSLYSYVFDTESDRIRLCPADEIFREAIGKDGIANATIVIYKLEWPVRRASEAGTCPPISVPIRAP